jgi:hypothetical protein
VKVCSYAVGIISFVEIFRGQVAEINLLQLVPGFYLLLLFLSFLILIGSSTALFYASLLTDVKKEYGTKTSQRLRLKFFFQFSTFFLFILTGQSLITLIPLSLDSLNVYGEKTLENAWSFDEVIFLEIILLVLVILLSQFPFISLFIFHSESGLNLIPKYLRKVSFLVFLIAGFLTPTIDGYTQLGLSLSTITLFVLILNIAQKSIYSRFFSVLFIS